MMAKTNGDPAKAPFLGLGGTQRSKRGPPPYGSRPQQYQVHRRPRDASAATKARRRRSSRAPPDERRCKLFCRLVTALVVVFVISCCSGLRWSRQLSSSISEGFVDGKGEPFAATETATERLRREVSGLEEALLRKKELLGVAPGTLLADTPGAAESNLRGTGRDGTTVAPDEVPRAPHKPLALSEGAAHRHDKAGGGSQDSRASQLPAPPGGLPHSTESTGVAGAPMFGLDPVRRSLESLPNLIREPVPLVVGGTDGSGTRGVVALLQRLQVPMIVEDRGTMDVHASPYMAKGGWPSVVRPVIEWAHGAGYDPRAAPDDLRRRTVEALDRLKANMNKSLGKLQAKDGPAAKFVSWGFKAPVSMLLVPFFAEAWGKAKFIHVVRDGRDIAFSGNQTPVEKFYEDTFPLGSRARGIREPPLKAITMWNTWNAGLYDWAAGVREEGGAGLDYLLLHTEDLMDPAAKFAAIKDVAEFVGSPLSDRDLCCIATEVSKDMGSHTTAQKERGHVNSRFGKWKGKVEGDRKLSNGLHDEGERALRLFGYEPERSVRTSDGYQCPQEHDPTCPKPPAPSRTQVSRPRNVRQNQQVPEDLPDTPTCVGLSKHVDFMGLDIGVANTEEHLDCCLECRNTRGCSHFTFDYKSGACYLKSGKGQPKEKNGLVSGAVLVP